MTRRPFPKDNDLRVRLKKLRTIDAPAVPVLDATATYVIVKESDGSTFASGTLPVQGTDGWYWVTIDKSVAAGIEVDVNYKLTITAQDVAGDAGTWNLELYGAER